MHFWYFLLPDLGSTTRKNKAWPGNSQVLSVALNAPNRPSPRSKRMIITTIASLPCVPVNCTEAQVSTRPAGVPFATRPTMCFPTRPSKKTFSTSTIRYDKRVIIIIAVAFSQDISLFSSLVFYVIMFLLCRLIPTTTEACTTAFLCAPCESVSWYFTGDDFTRGGGGEDYSLARG